MKPVFSNLHRLIPLGLAVLVLAGGCRREPPLPPPAEPTVAIVDGKPVTLKQLEAEVQRRVKTGAVVDPVKLLDDIVRREALCARAEKDGYANRPEIRAAIRELIANRFFEERLAASPAALAVSEADVRERYEIEKPQNIRPEAMNLALLRLECSPKATDEKKAEALAAASRLREQAQALPAGFGALAEAHSTHQASRYRGGELGWLTRAQLELFLADPDMAAAAAALQKPGEITAPLHGRDGLYLFRLIGRRAAQPVPYEERRPALQQKMAVERQRAREAQALHDAQQGIAITINRELAATLKPAKTNVVTPPPSMPKS